MTFTTEQEKSFDDLNRRNEPIIGSLVEHRLQQDRRYCQLKKLYKFLTTGKGNKAVMF